MRTYKDINFYFNFIIHNYNTKKIHDLIMCKDIHQWMTSSSITDNDLPNGLIPIIFCIKNNDDNVHVYEYLKIFINSSDENNGKMAFIQKGNHYNIIEKYINTLIEKNIIEDLLLGKDYTIYNLTINEGVSSFLNKFLSLVLISEDYIGEKVKLDIQYYVENKLTYDYVFNTLNQDSSIFNTCI
jgi:hypothetical protein